MAILVCSALIYAADPDKINFDQIKIANIGIGFSKSKVDRTFGKIYKSNTIKYPVFCETEIEISYKKIYAYFCGNKLVNLICKNPKFKTPSGIRVGMKQALVILKYGQPEVIEDLHENKLIYRSSTGDSALIFYIKDDVVISIELWTEFT